MLSLVLELALLGTLLQQKEIFLGQGQRLVESAHCIDELVSIKSLLELLHLIEKR